MALGTIAGFSLLTLILFIVPGWLGVKLALVLADVADWLNRIDTIVSSLVFSIVSLSLLYFTICLVEFQFLLWQDIAVRYASIPTALSLYTALVGIASLLGIAAGSSDRFYQLIVLREGPWGEFFRILEDGNPDDPTIVRVVQQNGDEIRGRKQLSGETAHNRDINLRNPLIIIRGDDGSVEEKYKISGLTYIHNQSIARIEHDDIKNADRFQNPPDGTTPNKGESQQDEEMDQLSDVHNPDEENGED